MTSKVVKLNQIEKWTHLQITTNQQNPPPTALKSFDLPINEIISFHHGDSM
jgi:hypothetical protein